MNSTISVFPVKRRILLASLLAFGLIGCTSAPKGASYDPSTNPASAISELEQSIQAGLVANYDVTDEANFSAAQKKLESAKSELANNEKQDVVLTTLAQSRAYLAKAKEKSAGIEKSAQGILDARTAAVDAGVRKFPSQAADLKQADDDFRSEVGDMNSGKLSSERWSQLQASYLKLELVAVQNTKLGDAQSKIEGARKNGGMKNTPNTLKTAEFDLQNAKNVIAIDRRNDEKSAAAVAKANRSAQMLIEVLSTTKQPGSRISEAVAINMVRQNHKISDLDQQVDNLDQQVSDQSGAIDTQNQQLAKQGRQIEYKDAAMKLENALNNARKEFTAEEAEVYRQGNNLLIRLKSMNFASGRSDLPASSLAVLGKVKDLAQELNAKQVVVQGHTDSVGDAAKNLALSQSRAEAVETYFTSNGVDKEKVQAIGYGFKKPLMTNKTSAGRATNRRVDVIITPSDTASKGV